EYFRQTRYHRDMSLVDSASALGAAYESSIAPRRRKSAGVYYTPAHIVEHIVRQTLDKIAPAPRLRILDPACGCGAFLLGAYQFLLDRRPGLTLRQRQRILLDHIFGVDIDPQAVEVTRAALLLKCHQDQPPARPIDLSDNIRCGNSLDGFDWPIEFDAVIGNPPWGSKLTFRDAHCKPLAGHFGRRAHNLNIFAL